MFAAVKKADLQLEFRPGTAPDQAHGRAQGDPREAICAGFESRLAVRRERAIATSSGVLPPSQVCGRCELYHWTAVHSCAETPRDGMASATSSEAASSM